MDTFGLVCIVLGCGGLLKYVDKGVNDWRVLLFMGMIIIGMLLKGKILSECYKDKDNVTE